MTTTDAATTSAIALRLELLGLSVPAPVKQSEADRLMSPILARQRELSRRLAHRPCAADQRIQTFLDSYLEGAVATPKLPRSTFVLDQPGLARALSLPADSTSFTSDYVESYKVLGGVLHNPRNDRRTTAGVFHVAEGGLPIPDDKIAVPRDVFARLLDRAVEIGVQEGLNAAVRGARPVGQASGQLALTGQDRRHEAVGLAIEVGAGGMIRDGDAEQLQAQRDRRVRRIR